VCITKADAPHALNEEQTCLNFASDNMQRTRQNAHSLGGSRSTVTDLLIARRRQSHECVNSSAVRTDLGNSNVQTAAGSLTRSNGTMDTTGEANGAAANPDLMGNTFTAPSQPRSR
jgi:predicted chitinase